MAITVPPTITALPPPPDPAVRSTFKTLAYPWSLAQGVLATEANAVATNVYNNALEAQGYATSASSSATASASSATASASSASDADTARIAAEAAVASIPAGSVNDTVTGTSSVWSSTKTAAELATKQDTLVSGTNIKTVGGVPVLGTGDIPIPTAITPLGVVTGTNVATIDITGLDTLGVTYDRIMIMGWVYANTDSNGAIYSRMQVGGVWATGSYGYFREVGTVYAASLTVTNSNSATFIPISEGAGALDRWKANLNMTIFRTPDNKTLEWSVVSETVTAALVPGRVRGMADRSGSPGTFQGIRFYAATGNVSGVLRVYGIQNS